MIQLNENVTQMIAAMKEVYQGVQVIDMSQDMQEEQRLKRKTRKGDKASIMACESRKVESSSKFMNRCTEDMVMQVRTKQARVRTERLSKI